MEKISDREICGMMIMVVISGIILSGTCLTSGQNAWIAVALSVLLLVPIYLIYARMGTLFGNTGFLEIARKVLSKGEFYAAACLYVFYCLLLGSVSMRGFSEFNRVASMPETGHLLTLVCFGAVCMYALKKGISAIGRFTNFLLPILIFMILLVDILSVRDWDLNNMLPLLRGNTKNFFKDIYTYAVFPLDEAAITVFIFGMRKKQGKAHRVYLRGLIISGAIMVIEVFRSVAVLGAHTASLVSYPEYAATGIINVMDFFNRAEVVSAVVFVTALIVKVCLCAFAVCRALELMLGASGSKTFAVPVMLLMTALALVVYKNSVEAVAALEQYKLYSLVFQVIIPVYIWIRAEIYAKREGKASSVTEKCTAE